MRFISLFLILSISAHTQTKPNIIYIMSDDHDADAISAYNKTFLNTPSIDRLAKEGMRFTNAFVGNSICGPARATLLTGQHSHNNGVKDNRTRFDSSKETLPHIMRRAGYQTAVVGKWHLHSYPSGFDYWKIFPGQGLYFNPRMINMSGDTVTVPGYSTDVVANESIKWIEQRDKNKPFMLLLHHKSPHRNFMPTLKYALQFKDKVFPEPPTLYADTAGKGSAWRIQTMSILHDMRLTGDLKIDPSYLANLPHLQEDSGHYNYYESVMNRIPKEEREELKKIYSERGKILVATKPKGKELLKLKYQWYMRDFMACVASIDENIGKLLDYLDKSGLSGNTAVIYTSDQGFYLGENGWFDKRFMYDVSMQTPLLVRWPGKIKSGTVNESLVQNIDYAPTMLDVAGIKSPAWMDGVSLKPVLTGQQFLIPRDNLYYHYYEFGRDHSVIPHLGIRDYRFKLIYFYTVNEWELYNLLDDPHEQNNLIKEKRYERVLAQMKQKLREARDKYGDHEAAGELR